MAGWALRFTPSPQRSSSTASLGVVSDDRTKDLLAGAGLVRDFCMHGPAAAVWRGFRGADGFDHRATADVLSVTRFARDQVGRGPRTRGLRRVLRGLSRVA